MGRIMRQWITLLSLPGLVSVVAARDGPQTKLIRQPWGRGSWTDGVDHDGAKGAVKQSSGCQSDHNARRRGFRRYLDRDGSYLAPETKPWGLAMKGMRQSLRQRQSQALSTRGMPACTLPPTNSSACGPCLTVLLLQLHSKEASDTPTWLW